MERASFRIFAGHDAAARGPRRPAREPASEAAPPTTVTVLASSPPVEAPGVRAAAKPSAAASLAVQMQTIVDAPSRCGESVREAFTRKERELARLFESLDAVSAGRAFERLSIAAPDDPACDVFGRLVAERRSRLLQVLAKTRR